MARAGWRAALARRLVSDWARERPTLLCQALRPLAWVYASLAWLHRHWQGRTPQRERHPGVPVVVVGNLVAGGAGKTPTVIHLVQALRAEGWSPGVVSRGHGGTARSPMPVTRRSPAAEVGDEPLLIHLRTEAPVWVGQARLEAARQLRAAEPTVNLIVSDDGLQHLALARDAQVIVFDERGVGNGLLLPAGPLREPMPPEPPPRSVVLYNAPRASTSWPGHHAARQLGGVVALAAWWQGAAGDAGGWATLRGRPLVAAAGLARPEPFFAMLQAQGLQITCMPLPDHHDYTTLPWPPHTPDVIVTEKDAVKLRPDASGDTRVWVATLDFRPDDGFVAELIRLLPPPPAAPHATPPP